MTRIRKTLAATGLLGAAIAAGVTTNGLIADVPFARAQDAGAAAAAAAAKGAASTRQGLAQIEDLSTVFRHVGKQIEPSVVNIKATKNRGNGPVAGRLPFDEDMLRRFFPDRDGDGEPDIPEGLDNMPDMPLQGTGSGVIMEVNGSTAYIVTNNHVASDASELVITFADGRVVENATLVGTDSKTDIAVVKVQADNLTPASWGNSDELQKGDWIMAFGSPFGYIGSMTHGIVSALNRSEVRILGPMGYENFIQVDAPINPGNSGGPLVNVRGEVVGINTAIASQTGGFQGIGFAIPSNQAKQIYATLKDKGRVVRGYLGVAIDDVDKPKNPLTEMALKQAGFQGKDGVLVLQVTNGTPSYGKLRPNDVITALDGKPVDDVQELRNTIAAIEPGTDTKLTVMREGRSQEVTVRIGEQPDELGPVASAGDRGNRRDRGGNNQDAAAGKLDEVGLKLETATGELAEKHGFGAESKGAVVTEVDRGSPAARAGLRPGDLITKVGGQDVTSAREVTDALAKADLAEGVMLNVENREGTKVTAIKTQP